MLRFSLLVVVNKFHDHFSLLFQLNICWSSNYDILMQTYVAEIAEIVRAQSRDEEEIGLLQGRLSRVRQIGYCRWWNNELCSGDQGIGRSEELAPNLSSSTVRFENPLLFCHSSIRLENIFWSFIQSMTDWVFATVRMSRSMEDYLSFILFRLWSRIFRQFAIWRDDRMTRPLFLVNGEMIWSSFPILYHLYSHPLS